MKTSIRRPLGVVASSFVLLLPACGGAVRDERVPAAARAAGPSLVLRQGLNGYAGVTDVEVSSRHPPAGGTGGTGGARAAVTDGPAMGAYRIDGEGGYEVRSFLRFGALPSLQGRRVQRAELALTFRRGSSGHALSVQALTKGWNAGDARFGWTNTGTGERWPVPGGGSSDWEAGPAATLDGAIGSEADTRVVALPADLVQRWIDQPQHNHGLALVATVSGQGAWLRSSEDAQPAWRPNLRLWLQ